MFSSHPIVASAVPTTSAQLHLPSFVIQNLKDKGIDNLFPSQAEIVPFLMRERYDHDICVMSPTGSGKTLAYAIPITKRLYQRVIPRIRALILVPTNDLVLQVASVFEYLVKNTDLRVCSTSALGLKNEQAAIVNADIVIATAGRLQTHIDYTKGFTLEHLEFLVLDEADKLLRDFAEVVTAIFPAIYNNKQGSMHIASSISELPSMHIATVRVPHYHPKAFNNTPPLRRWLFSATLTEQSAQLAQLHLQSPVFFTAAADKKYQFPTNLLQYFICVEGDVRGVALVKLIDDIIQTKKTSKIACFAQTVDTCHRLFVTLKLMRPSLAVAEFYGSLSETQRASVLSQFERGSVKVVVCSDLMARGLDIASIDAIVNYDVPEDIKTYVHRVGRTARGLNIGKAYSLIDPSEKVEFHTMVQKSDNLKLEEIKYDDTSYGEMLINQFKDVVPKLQAIMKQESITRKKIIK